MLTSRALIIVAHGSRRESSNEEVKALGQSVKALQGSNYHTVLTSFLEFAAPSLEASLVDCISEGVSEIVILPYFLASGNHVTRDIPEVIKKVQDVHPQVKISLKEHLGSAVGMVKLLSDMAK
ncbi:CbiX/SirB N-terminal domain-containing protein [Sulfurovum sp.]|uniref:sirohydrochlorin chelatase n=1 Tax=Sulfurovum sp. TaxID=1969726 RepID=UPI0025D56465|nr:CbiX/SirB N-terminal domain-containing protein [Sulfurovum sp.]